MQGAREVAFLSLERCEKQKKYSNLEIDSTVKRYSFEKSEKNLYVSLVYGVIERILTLDFIIASLSLRKLEEIDIGTLISIRLGLYQLIFMDKIPDNAAVDESVKLAKRHSGSGGGNFTNAVLRSFLRACQGCGHKNINEILNRKPFSENYEKLNNCEKISVLYSYPVYICEMFSNDYNEKNAVKILDAMNRKGALTLRVNTLKRTREDIITELSERGIRCKRTTFSSFGINVLSGAISDFSDLIDNGFVFVQDEASQIASMVLSPEIGDSMIDCCACPGGKSFSSAILMQNKGKLISCDLHKSKLSLIEKGAKRLGIDIIQTLEADASANKSEFDKSFDRVLCDVPCSGLGVIAKKPEIRYKNKEDIENLPEIQYRILKNCSKYLKPGGILVYSTCTLNSRENTENVKKFLTENPDFSPCDFELASKDKSLKSQDGMITLFPHINNTDGFFIAKIRKDN